MGKRKVEGVTGRRGGWGNCGQDAIYERRINKKKGKLAELLVKPWYSCSTSVPLTDNSALLKGSQHGV